MKHSFLPTAIALSLALYAVNEPVTASLPSIWEDGKPMPTLAPMIERASPAVVNIATYGTVRVQNPLLDDPFFRQFFNIPRGAPQQKRRTQSAGSGVIIEANQGYILTNHHVVDKADEIKVTLSDGRVLDAKLVGSDPDVDVAVLKVSAKNLSAITMADSKDLRVGDFVVAIGNPFGLGQTVTSGIISAVGRSGLGIEDYEDFIQTDASINPGNSGGALVNLKGELIGINTAILAPSGGNVGIGFAIPSNLVKHILDQIVTHGKVQRGWLGVVIQEVTPDMIDALGTSSGVLISQVEPGSPADKAGIKAGDVVVSINGQPIKYARELRNKIGLMQAGKQTDITVLRDGKQQTFAVKVTEVDRGKTAFDESINRRLEGALFRDTSDRERRHPSERIVIAEVQPDSPAYAAGLRAGDFLQAVNRKPVKNIREFQQMLAQVGNKPLMLTVSRNGASLFIILR